MMPLHFSCSHFYVGCGGWLQRTRTFSWRLHGTGTAIQVRWIYALGVAQGVCV